MTNGKLSCLSTWTRTRNLCLIPAACITLCLVACSNNSKVDKEAEVKEKIEAKTDGNKTTGDEATNSVAEQQSDEAVCGCEEMPEFPGGIVNLISYMSDNIKYPQKARKEGVQGQVMVAFIVSKDGSLKNIQIAKGVSPELDAEALRVVKMMPKWTPGKNEGKTVDVKYELPVDFKLP